MSVHVKIFIICSVLWICAMGCAREVVYKDPSAYKRIIDDRSLFLYFNEKWIPSVRTQYLDLNTIETIRIKKDEYGNKAAFVYIPQQEYDSLISLTEKYTKDIWIDNDPQCYFPGGQVEMLRWIKKNIRIPKNFSGKRRIIMSFSVLPNGKIEDIKVLKGIDNPYVEKEAIRLIKSMPRWEVKYCTPKRHPVRYNLPITFESPKKIQR